MGKTVVGHIQCPMCGTTGTVHKANVGRPRKNADPGAASGQVLYYRCDCGAIQPRREPGQRYIREHMTPEETAPAAKDDPTPAPAEPAPAQPAQPEPAPEGAEEYEPRQRCGFFEKLMREE